jgi:hypothetical protein
MLRLDAFLDSDSEKNNETTFAARLYRLSYPGYHYLFVECENTSLQNAVDIEALKHNVKGGCDLVQV